MSEVMAKVNLPAQSIVDAVRAIELFAEQYECKDWKIGGIASRGYAETLEQELASSKKSLNEWRTCAEELAKKLHLLSAVNPSFAKDALHNYQMLCVKDKK